MQHPSTDREIDWALYLEGRAATLSGWDQESGLLPKALTIHKRFCESTALLTFVYYYRLALRSIGRRRDAVDAMFA